MAGLQANTGAMNTNGKDTVANLSANEFQKSFEAQAENLNRFRALLNELGEAISQGANILNRTEEENASAGARLY